MQNSSSFETKRQTQNSRAFHKNRRSRSKWERFWFAIHGIGQLSLVLIRMMMNDGCSMYYLKLLLGLAIRSTTHSNA
jgi:hypothetical protein